MEPVRMEPASAEPDGRGLRVTRSLYIPSDELRWRFSTAGGPGGQHANRSHTAAEVTFLVDESASLGPRQRERLLATLGATVTARASEERSQSRNRDKALERLRDRLAEALKRPRPRIATAPSRSAKERRLESKRQRGDLKRQRQRRADPFE